MRWIYALTCVFSVAWMAHAEEMHKWRSKTGADTVEAVFDKIDGQNVLLKDKAGKSVAKIKLENLCEADQAYIEELTYVPREVTVTFKRTRLFGDAFGEVGESPDVTIRDAVTLQWASGEGGKAETTGDSVWKVESVNAVDKPLSPVKEGSAEKLDTRGKFVLVSYEVRNMSKVPARQVPPPVLYDQTGCPFAQYERAGVDLHSYMPATVLLAGADTLQPGMPQLFWAFYEMPQDAVPACVEVFPLKSGQASAESAEMKGKRMFLSAKLAKAGLAKPAQNGAADKGAAPAAGAPAAEETAPLAPDKKLVVTLNATKTKQEGDTRSNYVKTRSFTYQIDVRVLSAEVKQVPVTIKVFFTGTTSERDDLVVDHQDKDVVIEQNKIFSEAFTSKEIRELRGSYFYYYYADNARKRTTGAQLNGVIVQVWSGGNLVKGISKGSSSLKKYEESKDVVKDLGELKEGTGSGN